MKRRPPESSPSPAVHSENIRRQLTELIEHVEADTGRVDDPRFRGLLQKSAEVLKNLRTLFERLPTSGNSAKGKGKGKQPAPGRSKTEATRDAAASVETKEIQRKEARAPMMPSKIAPKMMPPQSGKPVWDKPHSS